MMITLTSFLICLLTTLFASFIFTMVYTNDNRVLVGFLLKELIKEKSAEGVVWACHKETGEWDFYNLNDYSLDDLEILDSIKITEKEREMD